MENTDVLVIGSGIAGLSFALKIATELPEASITIITKADESESNTKYAQGGIAVVTNLVTDSYQQHIEDTMQAGDYLNDRAIVEMVVKEAPERLNELVSWGARFDRSHSGEFKLAREGGHTSERVIHHKDMTGYEMEISLLDRIREFRSIRLLPFHFAYDLITKNIDGNKTCIGAKVLNIKTGKINTVLAKATMIAAGGAGQVYIYTTNPTIATGDGIAMAHRAGVAINHMEFIQFHPTALFEGNTGSMFLISEAVRGDGATLKTPDGQEFMENYDPRGSLASRDIVARAIETEMRKANYPFVYLDCRHLALEDMLGHFPNIYHKCRQSGFDMAKDMIPVAPAAHYICGGIQTDEWGQTNIANLYAAGENASTGLHGANRLASNSLLEALVFAHRSYLKVVSTLPEIHVDPYPEDIIANNTLNKIDDEEIARLRGKIQSIMFLQGGITRTYKDLEEGLTKINAIKVQIEEHCKWCNPSVELGEIRNLAEVATLILEQSIARKENKGGYYNSDLVKEKTTLNKS